MAVPADYTFTDLAKVIMIAFNWSGSHLWQFQQRDPSSREMTALVEQRDEENTLQVKFIASERLGSPRVFYDADLEVINDQLELYLPLKFRQMPPHF